MLIKSGSVREGLVSYLVCILYFTECIYIIVYFSQMDAKYISIQIGVR